MHPYRDSTLSANRSSPSDEERVLYVLLVAIGAIPVILAGLQVEAFGVEATVGLLMMGAGLLGVLGQVRRGRAAELGAGVAQPGGSDDASRSR